jgi:RNA-directed DNA polymerase
MLIAISESRRPRRNSVRYPVNAGYLHYVFDLWAKRWRRREATRDMIIVRYADDLIVGFRHEAEARCFLEIMRARLDEFSLSLHPDKTRLIEFGRFAAANRKRRGPGKPETFNFLGFTFISGKSRRGHSLIKRKTRRERLGTKLQEIKKESRCISQFPNRGQWLEQIITGYFHYHAAPTNSPALARFRHHIGPLWLRVLRRRSPEKRLHVGANREETENAYPRRQAAH